MTYNPAMHHRRSIRLAGYDYSQAGAYFVTICAQNREHLFGEIVNGIMQLNEYGQLVEFTWHDLVNHNGNIELREFVIMPNHVHGIIVIAAPAAPPAPVRAGSEPAPTPAPPPLSEIVRQFKTFSARRINEKRGMRGVPVWQRNYWEHIIRDQRAYDNIARYIRNNPLQWQTDKLNPQNDPK